MKLASRRAEAADQKQSPACFPVDVIGSFPCQAAGLSRNFRQHDDHEVRRAASSSVACLFERVWLQSWVVCRVFTIFQMNSGVQSNFRASRRSRVAAAPLSSWQPAISGLHPHFHSPLSEDEIPAKPQTGEEQLTIYSIIWSAVFGLFKRLLNFGFLRSFGEKVFTRSQSGQCLPSADVDAVSAVTPEPLIDGACRAPNACAQHHIYSLAWKPRDRTGRLVLEISLFCQF